VTRRLGVRARRAARAAPFRYSCGEHGARVTIEERADRSGRLQLRYTDPRRRGRDRRVKVRMTLTIRDAAGKPVEAKIKRAKQIAEAQSARLAADRAGTWRGPVFAALTLRQGVDIALATNPGGVYLGAARQHADAARLVRRLIHDFLPEDELWDAVRPEDVMAGVVRWVAAIADKHQRQRSADSTLPSHTPSPRSLEIAVTGLTKIARWLVQSGRVSGERVLVPEDWHAQLGRAWKARFHEEHTPCRLRHEPADVAKLLRAATDHGDPRFRLLFDVGAELRLGQLLACDRTDLNIERRGVNCRITLHIPRQASKPGTDIELDDSQVERMQAILASGYLSKLEREFVTAVRQDYPLFPGGKLRKGVVTPRKRLSRWNRRSALDAFHELERHVGITPVPRRGWYGVRRTMTDVAALQYDDDLLLEKIGANSRETRDRVYRDRENRELLGRAREARNVVRAKMADDGVSAPVVTLVPKWRRRRAGVK